MGGRPGLTDVRWLLIAYAEEQFEPLGERLKAEVSVG
jgi:hypothetical protein